MLGCCRSTVDRRSSELQTSEIQEEVCEHSHKQNGAARSSEAARIENTCTPDDVMLSLQLWLLEKYDWDKPLEGWTGRVYVIQPLSTPFRLCDQAVELWQSPR